MPTKKNISHAIDDGSHTLEAPPKHAELPAHVESEEERAKGASKEPPPPDDPDEHPRTAKPAGAD